MGRPQADRRSETSHRRYQLPAGGTSLPGAAQGGVVEERVGWQPKLWAATWTNSQLDGCSGGDRLVKGTRGDADVWTPTCFDHLGRCYSGVSVRGTLRSVAEDTPTLCTPGCRTKSDGPYPHFTPLGAKGLVGAKPGWVGDHYDASTAASVIACNWTTLQASKVCATSCSLELRQFSTSDAIEAVLDRPFID